LKILKKWCKIWGYRAKNPVFRSKSSEKVRKFRKKFWNFGNWLFRMFGNFGNLEIPNFPKTSKKWRPIRTSEITKYSFRLGNRPESSVKSSECRALRSSWLVPGSISAYSDDYTIEDIKNDATDENADKKKNNVDDNLRNPQSSPGTSNYSLSIYLE